MSTQIVSLDYFAGLYTDMQEIEHGDGPRPQISGTHPTLGRISFEQICGITGDGVLTQHEPVLPSGATAN